MSTIIDARVAVRFGHADPHSAALIQAGLPDQPACTTVWFAPIDPLPAHPAGCACCVPRGPMSDALRQLFLARAKNQVPFFRAVSVFADPANEAALRAALRDDPLLAAWFRADPDQSAR